MQMDKYEFVKEIGSGGYGVTKLMRNRDTQELFAMKLFERGSKIDDYVAREIVNHRSLRHPNVVRFKELVLTPTHLAIVMEYVAGGDLFDRINKADAGRFSEDEARYFFQQLITGIGYCHSLEICHRDLKLENTLLDESCPPCVKICDFGYSKSAFFHSKPKSTVGTPAYIAPEVISCKEYNGKLADVWSCGVVLYVMLFGKYPFEDQDDPTNFKTMVQKIKKAHYKIPNDVWVSQDCKHLLSRIFVTNPVWRINIRDIKKHPWFLKDLPSELTEAGQAKLYKQEIPCFTLQSVEDIMKILDEARKPPAEDQEKKDETEKTVETSSCKRTIRNQSC